MSSETQSQIWETQEEGEPGEVEEEAEEEVPVEAQFREGSIGASQRFSEVSPKYPKCFQAAMKRLLQNLGWRFSP